MFVFFIDFEPSELHNLQFEPKLRFPTLRVQTVLVFLFSPAIEEFFHVEFHKFWDTAHKRVFLSQKIYDFQEEEIEMPLCGLLNNFQISWEFKRGLHEEILSVFPHFLYHYLHFLYLLVSDDIFVHF